MTVSPQPTWPLSVVTLHSSRIDQSYTVRRVIRC